MTTRHCAGFVGIWVRAAPGSAFLVHRGSHWCLAGLRRHVGQSATHLRSRFRLAAFAMNVSTDGGGLYDERDGEGESGMFEDAREAAVRGVSTAVPLSADANVNRSKVKDKYVSVFKVFVHKTEPSFSSPWQMKRQRSSTGSAFAISGQRLLTNAHVVAYASQVLVRRHGEAKRYIARIIAVAHDSDLALLHVEDPAFWAKGIQPLELKDDAPHLQDSVTVIGYPSGGENLSITAGVVSRVDVWNYAHSGCRMLCIQIDAAINSGNSGGPALNKDLECVGIAFQSRTHADNIGYIVPVPIIKRFLRDIEQFGGDNYQGVVTLGIVYQKMENEQLRKYTGLAAVKEEDLPEGISARGVYVCYVDPLKTDTEYFHPGDVILAMDSMDIDMDGTVKFREMERVDMLYALTEKLMGDEIRVVLLRDREVIERTFKLSKVLTLVPIVQYDVKPRYLIYAGCVFTPLSCDYLRAEYGTKYMEKANTSLLAALLENFREFPDQEIVLMSQVLAHESNVGYEFRKQILQSVNGNPIRNLAHLGKFLDETKDDFISFEFNFGVRACFEKETSDACLPEILKENNISSARFLEET
ncbi:Protease Do-like 9 [Porphyridium purpureum]|uniref:Protease Do-like 9 n=1 Tax=Porphyridium purpureum TaxID=35688 RepID=A0A5J4Z818_PORPP|nr:Protease Do-like 9 [Porphyridium purpureum]|eukprot:POR4660..scf295_1